MSDRAPNPYVGPVPFTINESARFYGRGGDLRRLMVLFVAQRIVLLYSPSGAGKTSLVQAKMIPALARKGFEVLPVIRVNRQPVDGSGEINNFVYSTISSLLEGGAGEAFSNGLANPENGDVTRADLDDFWQGRREALGNRRAVLFFDQFEEVLTVDPHDHAQKDLFFDQLGAILEEDDRLWALFAIREDYLAELDPYRHLIPGELDGTYRLELLNKGQALDAIQKPATAEDVGVTFSDEAAQKLVSQLRRVQVKRRDGQITFEEGPFVEPVQLQVVCQTLWQDLEPEVGGRIGAESVAAEGHVDESLGEFYDKTVAQIAAKKGVEERDVRDWFDRQLITEQGLREQVMGSEELSLSQHVIGDLVDAHLIRAEERRGIQWYELAHNRLVKPVRQHNEDWYEQNLSLLQVRAEAWKRNREQGLLLQGRELQEANAWATGRELKEYEDDFLGESHARERARRIRLISAGVILIVLVGIALGMFSLWQNAQASANLAATSAARAAVAQGDAEESAALALTREAEAVTAQVQADANAAEAQAQATIAAISEAEAEAQAELAAAREAEAEAQARNAQTQALMSFSTSLLPVNRNPTTGEVERSLLLSAQGMRMSLKLEQPVSARLLDEQARRLLAEIQARPSREVLRGHEAPVWSVAFGPEGARLASGSSDGTVRLWRMLPALVEFACEQAGRNFIWEEWQEFLPDREYEKTCAQYPVHCSVPTAEWPETFAEEQNLCGDGS